MVEALVARRPRRRRNPPALKPIRWPRRAHLAYARDLLRVLATVRRGFREQVEPELALLVADARLDAPADDSSFLFERFRGWLATVLGTRQIEELVDDHIADTESDNRRGLTAQLQSLGFEHIPIAPELEPILVAHAKENARLVRSLVTGTVDDLEGVVLRGLRRGTSSRALAREIAERFGVARSRAALIAEDQVGSLNGALTRTRHQSLGITHYFWSSSADERVRPRHQQLDGQRFSYASPPVVDLKTGRREHPGGDIRCRCSAIPDVSSVMSRLAQG